MKIKKYHILLLRIDGLKSINIPNNIDIYIINLLYILGFMSTFLFNVKNISLITLFN